MHRRSELLNRHCVEGYYRRLPACAFMAELRPVSQFAPASARQMPGEAERARLGVVEAAQVALRRDHHLEAAIADSVAIVSTAIASVTITTPGSGPWGACSRRGNRRGS